MLALSRFSAVNYLSIKHVADKTKISFSVMTIM